MPLQCQQDKRVQCTLIQVSDKTDIFSIFVLNHDLMIVHTKSIATTIWSYKEQFKSARLRVKCPECFFAGTPCRRNAVHLSCGLLRMCPLRKIALCNRSMVDSTSLCKLSSRVRAFSLVLLTLACAPNRLSMCTVLTSAVDDRDSLTASFLYEEYLHFALCHVPAPGLESYNNRI